MEHRRDHLVSRTSAEKIGDVVPGALDDRPRLGDEGLGAGPGQQIRLRDEIRDAGFGLLG